MNNKIEKSLSEALSRRQNFLEALKETDCYRFFSGKNEGIGGLKIEVYGTVAFIYQFVGKEEYREEELSAISEWLLKNLKIKSVHLKKFIEDRTKKMADEELLPITPLAGEKASDAFETLENGLSFQIRPFDGFSSGIFLDQRENRNWVRKTAQGKSVLNAFSYTCAFSVAAAIGGATVTSVDLSEKYLDWGKTNFKLNELSPGGHRFYAWDIFDFMKKAAKQKESFDLILLDPPSFSRGKNGVFSIKKDWKKLLLQALPLLKDKGILFYSCNFQDWEKKTWEKQIEEELKSINHKRIQLPKTPIDFEKEEHPLNSWCGEF